MNHHFLFTQQAINFSFLDLFFYLYQITRPYSYTLVYFEIILLHLLHTFSIYIKVQVQFHSANKKKTSHVQSK